MRSTMLVGALVLAASGGVYAHGGMGAGGGQGIGGPQAMSRCGTAAGPEACPMGGARPTGAMGDHGPMRGGPGAGADACPMHADRMASGHAGSGMRGTMGAHAQHGAPAAAPAPEAPAK